MISKISFVGNTDKYGKLVNIIIDGKQYFYIYNGNDEIIGLTNSSGEFAVRYNYDSWGVPTEYDKDGNVVSCQPTPILPGLMLNKLDTRFDIRKKLGSIDNLSVLGILNNI